MSDHTAREEAIVSTTLDLAEERGVAGVTTAGLARRLEFTEAALYRYFPGKAAIIAASIRNLGERLFATMLLELMPEAVGHGQGVHEQLDRHARRFALRNGLLIELLLAAVGGRDEELHGAAGGLLHEYGERMTGYFDALQQRGLIATNGAPSDLSRLWVCQLLGGFIRCRLEREAWDPVGQPGFLAFLAGLRAAGAVVAD